MFDKMPQKKCITLARQIAHHSHEGEATKSLGLFLRLLRSGEKVTPYILSALLKACGRLCDLEEGKKAHGMVVKYGLHADVALMTSLLVMYSKCTRLAEARNVFMEMEQRDVIATNGMIAAFFRCNRPYEAIQLFYDAPRRDVATWNSLISGLVQTSNSFKALHFFKQMALAGEKADSVTIVSVLSACADVAASSNGKQIHGMVVKHGHEACLPVGNAVVDMYAKVGSMEDANVCFRNMPFRNVITWTSLIVGYGKHGLGMEAMRAFDRMVLDGLVPNKVTFVGTLSACSHAGLVQEGWRSFRNMTGTYSITPEMEHYGCMVDLLARSGRLEEAWDFIRNMPVEPDEELWTGFLSSCFYYRNEELTKLVGEKMLEHKPQAAGAYILLSNFYGQMGNPDGVAKVRRLMMSRGIKKEKARTWIEIGRTVHAFESGDRSHPYYREILNYLEDLVRRIKAIGYVPNTDVVVQSVDEKMKEEMVLGHSEKLAIGLGLINTAPGTEIVIVKNLRVCLDCHAAIRFISEVEGREIIARDAGRFHKFRGGICSCGDHW